MLFLQPSEKKLPESEMFLIWSPWTHKKEVLEIRIAHRCAETQKGNKRGTKREKQ